MIAYLGKKQLLMYPLAPVQYYTEEYVEPLINLLAEAKTKLALDLLWYTIPEASPGHVRVMNLRSQFIEAEQRKLDGLGGSKKEKRRIRMAVKDVLENLRIEYPHVITLRRDPAVIGAGEIYEIPHYEKADYSDYELAEPEYRERSGSGVGLGVLYGVLLVVGVVFFLVKTSGNAQAGSGSRVVSGTPEIGWVLLLTDGQDCNTLSEQYDYVFRHHDGVEVVRTKRGGCSLLIRFEDKASAVEKMEGSTTLGPKFPGMRVLKL